MISENWCEIELSNQKESNETFLMIFTMYSQKKVVKK